MPLTEPLIYTSNSQRARVESESWIADNGYCLACESDCILPTKTNTQARDFECKICGHPYELKCASKPFGNRIVDGAYSSMMRRVTKNEVSSFLLMRYARPWSVSDLYVIHHSLITPEVIQQRPPLAETARRAGWVGCNILLSDIPLEGRIPIIVGNRVISKAESRAKFSATEHLAQQSVQARSCSRILLTLLRQLDKKVFTLADAYRFEGELAISYPDNRNLRPKIRQQLQVLRDAGLLTFEGRGNYSFTYK